MWLLWRIHIGCWWRELHWYNIIGGRENVSISKCNSCNSCIYEYMTFTTSGIISISSNLNWHLNHTDIIPLIVKNLNVMNLIIQQLLHVINSLIILLVIIQIYCYGQEWVAGSKTMYFYHNFIQMLTSALMEYMTACRTVTTHLVHTSARVIVALLLMLMEEHVMVSITGPLLYFYMLLKPCP